MAPQPGLEQVTGWLTEMSLRRLQRVEGHPAQCPIGVRHRSGLFVITVEQESAECPISVHRSRNRRGLRPKQKEKSPENRHAFRALLLGKLMLYQLSYSRTVTYASRRQPGAEMGPTWNAGIVARPVRIRDWVWWVREGSSGEPAPSLSLSSKASRCPDP